jgi:iron-sulfur cluster insertion protein
VPSFTLKVKKLIVIDLTTPVIRDLVYFYLINWSNVMSGCAKQNFIEAAGVKPLIFTENAADKVAALISEEGNPNLKLRVYIQGGGCSGFQYGFTFDESINPDDQAYTTKAVTLLVDGKSAKFLSGATIDYLEDLEGERFTIDNPNAKTSCSCGSSFDVGDESAN